MAEAKLDITDELLVAYVDDELDPAQRELVSSILAGNPALRRRAEEMGLARDLLREAFPLSPGASVPASIDAATDRLAEACAERSSRPRVPSSARARWKYAVAAGLVLCVAASAIYLAWRAGGLPPERNVTALMQIGPGTPLHDVLENSPSAEVIDVPAEDAAMRAVLTFRAKDGRFCREFEVLARSRDGSTGIACREEGGWRAEVLLSSEAVPPDTSHYAPASQADEPAVAEVVDDLIQGDPLSADEEARVLANGWRPAESP